MMCMDCGERAIDIGSHHCPPGKCHAIDCVDARHVADHDWVDCDERHGCGRPDECHREFRCNLPKGQHPSRVVPAPPVGDEAKCAIDVAAFNATTAMDIVCRQAEHDAWRAFRNDRYGLQRDQFRRAVENAAGYAYAAGRKQGAREEREACAAIAATGERLGSGMTLMKSQQQIADAIAARGKAGT